jgi:hypothetical protein
MILNHAAQQILACLFVMGLGGFLTWAHFHNPKQFQREE